MNRNQLKQLIREVLEEQAHQPSEAEIQQMKKALEQNPNFARELKDMVLSENNAALEEAVGGLSWRAIILGLLALGVSAGSVLKAESPQDLGIQERELLNSVKAASARVATSTQKAASDVKRITSPVIRDAEVMRAQEELGSNKEFQRLLKTNTPEAVKQAYEAFSNAGGDNAKSFESFVILANNSIMDFKLVDAIKAAVRIYVQQNPDAFK